MKMWVLHEVEKMIMRTFLNVWMFLFGKEKIGCHTKKGTASVSGTSDFVDVKS
jgi:hypothetical protein